MGDCCTKQKRPERLAQEGASLRTLSARDEKKAKSGKAAVGRKADKDDQHRPKKDDDHKRDRDGAGGPGNAGKGGSGGGKGGDGKGGGGGTREDRTEDSSVSEKSLSVLQGPVMGMEPVDADCSTGSVHEAAPAAKDAAAGPTRAELMAGLPQQCPLEPKAAKPSNLATPTTAVSRSPRRRRAHMALQHNATVRALLRDDLDELAVNDEPAVAVLA